MRRSAHFLARRAANHAALTPLTFLKRTADVFPDHAAIVYDDWATASNLDRPHILQTWAETSDRCTRLASALQAMGVTEGDTVAILSPNTPAFVEAHHGVNAAGAVLNPLNTRLDAPTLAYILDHSDAKVLLADTAYAQTTRDAIDELRKGGSKALPVVIDLVDPVESFASLHGGETSRVGAATYEELLASGRSDFEWILPEDEWDTQAINYTSGTTGKPKGVMYHHRGAALNAINNAITWGLAQHPRYLWTLPMFHCNGWCFPYTITMQAGVHVCLRQTEPSSIFQALINQDITHMCGAPVVMNMMLNSPDVDLIKGRQSSVKMLTAGAPPHSCYSGHGSPRVRCDTRVWFDGGLWAVGELHVEQQVGWSRRGEEGDD